MKNILIFFIFTMSMYSFSEVEDSDEFAEFEEVKNSDQTSFIPIIRGMLEIEEGEAISHKKLRASFDKIFNKGGLFSKTDFIHDDITYKSRIDVRELRLQYRLNSWLDLSIGRQVSTWGVGDMLFINDLFPKNWNANFQGREMEMLKDPSNTVRLTSYGDVWITDLVYTPKFTADTFPRGCYFDVYNMGTGKISENRDHCVEYQALDENGKEIKEDEISLSLKRKIKNHELAFYYYEGFYKSPKGVRTSPSLITYHPRLSVYGFSDEGQLGDGVFTFEYGYYDSKDDLKGKDYFIENSKMKYLIGYKMNLTSSFSFGTQWYQEKMLNYDNYEKSLLLNNPQAYDYRKKEFQNTLTLRLTYKAMQDTLFFNLFTYIRPEDKDSFSKIEVSKKLTDNLKLTTGMNIFEGKESYNDREFGMLKEEDNTFIRLNYNF